MMEDPRQKWPTHTSHDPAGDPTTTTFINSKTQLDPILLPTLDKGKSTRGLYDKLHMEAAPHTDDQHSCNTLRTLQPHPRRDHTHIRGIHPPTHQEEPHHCKAQQRSPAHRKGTVRQLTLGELFSHGFNLAQQGPPTGCCPPHLPNH